MRRQIFIVSLLHCSALTALRYLAFLLFFDNFLSYVRLHVFKITAATHFHFLAHVIAAFEVTHHL